jgi:hypothetical protein
MVVLYMVPMTEKTKGCRDSSLLSSDFTRALCVGLRQGALPQ